MDLFLQLRVFRLFCWFLSIFYWSLAYLVPMVLTWFGWFVEADIIESIIRLFVFTREGWMMVPNCCVCYVGGWFALLVEKRELLLFRF